MRLLDVFADHLRRRGDLAPEEGPQAPAGRQQAVDQADLGEELRLAGVGMGVGEADGEAAPGAERDAAADRPLGREADGPFGGRQRRARAPVAGRGRRGPSRPARRGLSSAPKASHQAPRSVACRSPVKPSRA